MRNILCFLIRLPLFLAGVAAFTVIGVPILLVLGLVYLILNVAWLIIISPMLVLGAAIKKEFKHLGEYFSDAVDMLAGPKQCIHLLAIIYASMIDWVIEA